MKDPTSAPGVPRLLRVAARCELFTLVLLVANLVAGHDEHLASAVGPVHGGLYLTVIITLLLREGTPGRVRALGLIPAVGGLLALRAGDRAETVHRAGP